MPANTNGNILTSSPQYSTNKQTRTQFGDVRRVRELTTVVPKMISSVTIEPGHYNHRIHLLGKMEAGPLEEGQEISTPTAFPTYSREFTTSEWGMMSFRSDRVQRQTATHDISEELNKRQGEAMARLEEREIIGLFSTLKTKINNSGNTQTSAGVVEETGTSSTVVKPKGINPMTLAHAKGDIMRERDPQLGAPPMGSRPFGVFAPTAITQMTTNLFSAAPASTTDGIGGPAGGGGGPIMKGGSVAIPHGLTEDIVNNYYVGESGGVSIYETPNIQVCQNTGSTALDYDLKYGEPTGTTVAAGTEYSSVSNGNATSTGAVIIPETLMLVKEKDLQMSSEMVPRMRGQWIISVQEFMPYVVYDAWGVFVYAQCGVLSSQPNYSDSTPDGFA